MSGVPATSRLSRETAPGEGLLQEPARALSGCFIGVRGLDRLGLGEDLRLLRRELVIGEHALGVQLDELLQLIG